jgi:hypothetical protein
MQIYPEVGNKFKRITDYTSDLILEDDFLDF